MGGGAASSRTAPTTNTTSVTTSTTASEAELDFSAVQRGDAEMGNRLNRVVRACVELGHFNPIVAIHDQVLFLVRLFL